MKSEKANTSTNPNAQAHFGLSNGASNAENKQQDNEQSNSELVTREDIPNSPLHIVGHKEHGYFIAIGMHRLTEPKPTREAALRDLRTNMWNIIMNLISTVGALLQKDIENKIPKEQSKNTEA